jgi:BarA-like signal transduction histidine kinase
MATAAMESRQLSLDLHGYRSDEAIREGKYYFDLLLLSVSIAFCNPLIIHRTCVNKY